MRGGWIIKIVTVAAIPVVLGGCSAVSEWLKPNDTAESDIPAATASPALPAAVTPQYENRIPRLSERPGIDSGKLARDATDVWDRIRLQLKLGGADRPEVQKEVDWYAHNSEFVERTAERARPYLYYIVEEIEKRQMPMEIALLPIVESAFRPDALSSSRAAGIWQFIAGTADRFGLKRSKYYDGRRDVMASTRAALDYLQNLHDQFGGDWLNAIAAYNCGEKTVERAIDANRRAGKPTDFWSLNLPQETTEYVPRLLAIGQVVMTPLRYNIALAPIPNKPYLTTVEVAQQVDLGKCAKLAGMTRDEMHTLNPGFLKRVTDPAGPHRLVLPVAQAGTFKEALADAGVDSIKASSTLHTVRKGESLSTIARHYGLEVGDIRTANSLSGNRLKIGQELVIPVAVADAKGVQRAPARARLASLETRGGDSGRIVHVVRPGDSLWTISRAYKVTVDNLLAWNGLRRGTVLSLDQQIVIWKHRGAEPRAIKTSLSSAEDVTAARLVKYEVRDGDSLWTIARHFEVSVEQLCQWNRLDRHEVLKPGNQLDVYVSLADRTDDGLRI